MENDPFANGTFFLNNNEGLDPRVVPFLRENGVLVEDKTHPGEYPCGHYEIPLTEISALCSPEPGSVFNQSAWVHFRRFSEEKGIALALSDHHQLIVVGEGAADGLPFADVVLPRKMEGVGLVFYPVRFVSCQ